MNYCALGRGYINLQLAFKVSFTTSCPSLEAGKLARALRTVPGQEKASMRSNQYARHPPSTLPPTHTRAHTGAWYPWVSCHGPLPTHT
jgi:hypothetical protein